MGCEYLGMTQEPKFCHPCSQKKARQMCSEIRVVMIVFFFVCNRIVYHERAPKGQIIMKEYHLEVMRHLSDTMQDIRPDLWRAQTWQLCYDSAPTRFLVLIQSSKIHWSSLYSIPKKELHQTCMQIWQDCWKKCIQSKEEYIEANICLRPVDN